MVRRWPEWPVNGCSAGCPSILVIGRDPGWSCSFLVQVPIGCLWVAPQLIQGKVDQPFIEYFQLSLTGGLPSRPAAKTSNYSGRIRYDPLFLHEANRR